jgi:drug/metabolite transporter (DMT)-like permease
MPEGTTMSRYLKLVQFVLLAVVGGTGAALFDGHGLSRGELANIAVLVVTAVSVYLARNTPEQPWAKTAVAVLGAGVAVLTSAWSDHRISPAEIQQIVLAVLGAIGVATVANVPPGPQPEASVTTLDAHRDGNL